MTTIRPKSFSGKSLVVQEHIQVTIYNSLMELAEAVYRSSHQHHSEDTSTQSESNSFGEDYPRPGDDQTVILNRTHEDRSWEMRFQIQFKSASPSWNTTTRSHLPLILIEAGQLGTVTPHVYVVSSSDTYGSVSA
ncbi:hypothetical protein YC2023_046230 [Brassica napus]